MEPNFLKCSSIQTDHSTELKFGMHITVHRLIYCVDFGKFRINSVFTEVQKTILIHYGLWSKILESVLVSKRCNRLSSNLVCVLKVTVSQTLFW